MCLSGRLISSNVTLCTYIRLGSPLCWSHGHSSYSLQNRLPLPFSYILLQPVQPSTFICFILVLPSRPSVRGQANCSCANSLSDFEFALSAWHTTSRSCVPQTMAPPRQALAQSESKARFFERLCLRDDNEFHKRVYALMKVCTLVASPCST